MSSLKNKEPTKRGDPSISTLRVCSKSKCRNELKFRISPIVTLVLLTDWDTTDKLACCGRYANWLKLQCRITD